MDKTLFLVPTRDGNGFESGKVYRFEHRINGSYFTYVKGHERVISLPLGDRCAHLWDGSDWDNAGRFLNVAELMDEASEL